MSSTGYRLETLEEIWFRSDFIFDLLKPEAFLEQPIKLRQPFIFYLGHLPAFAWNQVLHTRGDRPSVNPEFDRLFARGIDPVGVDAYVPEEPHRWPRLGKVLLYRDRVRDALRDVFDGVEQRNGNERLLLGTVIEHELTHHETLMYMALRLPREKLAPPWKHVEPSLKGSRHGRRLEIPAGRVRLGAAREELLFGWDNEFPEHEAEVGAFEIDPTPVTNGELLEFVQAGGFERQELWTEPSWAWRERRGIEHPPFWIQDGEGWRYRTLLDELLFSEVEDWPAYVSWATAQAYARWRGARLPTEAEFHRAAYSGPQEAIRPHPWGDEAPGPQHGNFGFERWTPTPVGAHPAGDSAWGVAELVGNGWEWTSTVFGPHPGFEPMSNYPGYSQDFFDDQHYVMLGASWATDTRLVRRSFRNWFQPHYPYVFAKFRCVRSE